MKQFNGLNGCPTCLHPGERCAGTRVYLPGTYPLRTHDELKQAARKAEEKGEAVDGIKGKSALTKLVNLVDGYSNRLHALCIRRCYQAFT